MTNKAVLVTGGAGFIGLNIVEALLRAGESVIIFDIHPVKSEVLEFLATQGPVRYVSGDVREAAAVAALIRPEVIKCVVHAAAVTPDTSREIATPRQVVDTNYGGTLNILEAIRVAPEIRLINVGTAGVYGSLSGPTDGPPLLETRQLAPKSLYAISKLAGESLIERYATLFGVEAINFRVGYCFGPWEHETGLRDPMSIQLQLLRLAVAGKAAVLPRDGFKDWTYSRDVAEAVAHVVRNPGPIGPHNVTGPTQWAISEYTKLLAEHFAGFSASMASESDPSVNVSYNGSGDRPVFDLNGLTRILGYAPHYGLAEAASDYFAWADRWLRHGSGFVP
ncbi:MAG TPA: NAD(P)-dependent oxidoreductase [Arsenicitalea sp.]|jgi:nucleoside-diphosphate-sugar epimerase|nr:NAD(P)-dependent oxidoreductase [Arsenicitalea sp.]